ncbi:MAG TPA: hypothetical protein PK079_24080 [Leptospiraceae bacterium]|nr:hypothetical protein [Leptospiraceae bacterium]HMW08716.1 hypothetical protein [Leptospiraceae bacterium]HNC59678.1 hypothetical protein [Leptospiraceae bacterium]HNE56264.1 hypothetical protein [Leptospiraceae bacterium]HNF57758.1 hypothetical protein [Leptospiraceae bacterium]
MPTPAIFRNSNNVELSVKIDGYKDLTFFAKIPTQSEINELRLQLATQLQIGIEYIYLPAFDESLGYALLDKYLNAPYPSLIISVFEELAQEQRSWKYFPDSLITDSVIEALIDKVRENEEGKKKSKSLEALRKPVEPIRLVSNPTSQDLSEGMGMLGESGGTPETSPSTTRSTNQSPITPETNTAREPKKVRHRVG